MANKKNGNKLTINNNHFDNTVTKLFQVSVYKLRNKTNTSKNTHTHTSNTNTNKIMKSSDKNYDKIKVNNIK